MIWQGGNQGPQPGNLGSYVFCYVGTYKVCPKYRLVHAGREYGPGRTAQLYWALHHALNMDSPRTEQPYWSGRTGETRTTWCRYFLQWETLEWVERA